MNGGFWDKLLFQLYYKLLERESQRQVYVFISYLFFKKGEMEKVENGGFVLDSWEGTKFG